VQFLARQSGPALVVNRENLNSLAALLESVDLKVVIDKLYPSSEAADAFAHMLGDHARGKVVVAVQRRDARPLRAPKSRFATTASKPHASLHIAGWCWWLLMSIGMVGRWGLIIYGIVCVLRGRPEVR
jgi:Zinc-binding dehydrogenase